MAFSASMRFFFEEYFGKIAFRTSFNNLEYHI